MRLLGSSKVKNLAGLGDWSLVCNALLTSGNGTSAIQETFYDMSSLAVKNVGNSRRASLPDQSGWSASVIEMQEQDRRRISQELHDDLGQRLALLEIQLAQLEEKCVCPDTAKGLRSMRARVGEMDQDVHRICCQLYPVLLENLGLVIAVNSLCREFSQLGLTVEFMHENCPATLPKPVSLCLYRVVQEALHNVAKHSKAKSARVTLRGSSGRLEVIVDDSGIGFDRSLIRTRAGLGLTSIEERVKRAGGRSSINSTPGVGTEVKAAFYTFMLVD
jgi:signal transduction histidine kinase